MVAIKELRASRKDKKELQKSVNNFKEAAQGLKNATQEVITHTFNNARKNTETGIRKFHTWAAPKAKELEEKIAPVAQDLKEKVTPMTKNITDKVIESKDKLVESATAMAKTATDTISETVTPIIEEEKKLSRRVRRKLEKKAKKTAKRYRKDAKKISKSTKKLSASASQEVRDALAGTQLAQYLPKKEKKGHKGLIFAALASVAGAVGYFVWKKNTPEEDPWAEAYWEGEDVADRVSEKAEELKDAAADHITEAKDATEEKLKEVKDSVENKLND